MDFGFDDGNPCYRYVVWLVGPMLAAKARAGAEQRLDMLEDKDAEYTSFSGDGPAELRSEHDASLEPLDSGAAPASHMLCRRVLHMVQDLHRRGYERLRVAPGLSPSGLYWRCLIVPVDRVHHTHGAISVEGGLSANYGSGQGAHFFGWIDAESDSPAVLATKFLDRFQELADQGNGCDPEYARWYAAMLEATAPDGLIYAYADWDLPGDHIPALGCTADVKIPMPPPGEADSAR